MLQTEWIHPIGTRELAELVVLVMVLYACIHYFDHLNDNPESSLKRFFVDIFADINRTGFKNAVSHKEKSDIKWVLSNITLLPFSVCLAMFLNRLSYLAKMLFSRCVQQTCALLIWNIFTVRRGSDLE